jgi:hypothetical protein
VHANIISKLASSDLVLCDMSSLNPNVFFELGIRTALNKPVCLVKDDVTPNVPFDASIVHYHIYASKLAPWIMEAQILALQNHIDNTVKAERSGNAMWSYFGMSHAAHLSAPKAGDVRFEFLARQNDHLAHQLDQIAKRIDGKPADIKKPAAAPADAPPIADVLREFQQKGGLPDQAVAELLSISLELLEGLYSGEVVPSPALEMKIISVAG